MDPLQKNPFMGTPQQITGIPMAKSANPVTQTVEKRLKADPHASISGNKVDTQTVRSMAKDPPAYDELPIMTMETTTAIVSQFKEGEFMLRKSSDNKSLVVARKCNGQVQQIKFSPGAKPGLFSLQSESFTLSQIIEKYGGEKAEVRLGMPAQAKEKSDFESIKEFMHPPIPSSDADTMLKDKPMGTFLVRPSNSNPDHLVFSVATKKGVVHYKLTPDGTGKFKGGKITLEAKEWLAKFAREGNIIAPEKNLASEPLEMQAASSSTQSKEEILQSGRTKAKRAFARAQLLMKGTSKGAKPMAPLYWAELIHPDHGYGRQIVSFFNVWKDSSSTESFVDWMQKLENGQSVPGKDKIDSKLLRGGRPALSKVTYLNADQRKNYRITIDANNNGLIATAKEPHMTTGDQPHIFVVAPDNAIYAGVYRRGTFNHSSFLEGSPVQSAGELYISDGKITAITDKSGHYESDLPMVLKGIKALKEAGANLEGTKLILNAHPLSTVPKEEYDALDFYEQNKHLID